MRRPLLLSRPELTEANSEVTNNIDEEKSSSRDDQTTFVLNDDCFDLDGQEWSKFY